MIIPQGETRCRKRIKTLEFVVAGLREKLEDMALAEKRVAGTVERAEARAASAEGSERGLRASVGAIKVDFEARILTFFRFCSDESPASCALSVTF